MSDSLKKTLTDASTAGLVAPDKIDALSDFLAARHVLVREDDLIANETEDPNEDSEMPRFIRGYHDVLITVGVLITLVGVGGLGSVWAALVAVIILAEIFVRRQRLALPSFVLTLAFAICTAITVGALVEPISGSSALSDERVLLMVGAVEFVLLAVFYWRYQVPVAFSALLISGVATVVGSVALLLFGNQPELGFTLTLLVSGAILAALAVRYDLSDQQRITRRSDIAFWLYLVAVPAILKSIFDLVSPDQGALNAALMLVAVVVMMVLGLVMDRRAFVTAGLVYLGYAFGELLSSGTGGWFKTLASDAQFLWLMLAIGLIVLAVGFGWRTLRRLIIGTLPETLQTRIPVIR